MAALNLPVKMISLAEGEGALTPPRFRYEDEQQQPHVVRIDEVLEHKESNFVGVQSYLYICRAVLASGQAIIFKLRYTVKTHLWVLSRVSGCRYPPARPIPGLS